jgi:hypothetical protein
LASHLHNPSNGHLKAAEHVLCYLIIPPTGDFNTPSQTRLLRNMIQLNVYKVTLPGQLTRFLVSTPMTASTHSSIVIGGLKMPLIPKKVNSGVPMKLTHY